MCASLTIASKDMVFIQMKYVAVTMVSMFRLQRLVEYLAMGNPKLIHSLTTCMKGGFFILLERRRLIDSPSIPIITSFGSIFFTYKNTFIK